MGRPCHPAGQTKLQVLSRIASFRALRRSTRDAEYRTCQPPNRRGCGRVCCQLDERIYKRRGRECVFRALRRPACDVVHRNCHTLKRDAAVVACAANWTNEATSAGVANASSVFLRRPACDVAHRTCPATERTRAAVACAASWTNRSPQSLVWRVLPLLVA